MYIVYIVYSSLLSSKLPETHIIPVPVTSFKNLQDWATPGGQGSGIRDHASSWVRILQSVKPRPEHGLTCPGERGNFFHLFMYSTNKI